MIFSEECETDFTLYMATGFFSRIVPLVLEATGDADCLVSAEKLREDTGKRKVAMDALDAALAYADKTPDREEGYALSRCVDKGDCGDYGDAYAEVSHFSGVGEAYAELLAEAVKFLPAGAVPIIPNFHKRVYEAATRPGFLEYDGNMRAALAVALGGEAGEGLEEAFGTDVAGALIYAWNAGTVPDLYSQNKAEVLADIKFLAS